MQIPASLRDLALTRDGVITAADARAHGVSRVAIRRLVEAGELVVVARGVHRVAAHPLTARTRMRMSTLRAGARGILSGSAAAWWWGIADHPAQITVTMPAGSRLKHVPGVRIRYRNLDAVDVTVECGLAVTALPLSVLEAGVESGTQLVDNALLRRHVTEDQLRAAHARRHGCEDATAMARLLEGIGEGARSAAERVAIAIFRDHGIAGWVAGYPCLRYEIDFAFVGQRVAVEIDGLAHHRDAKAFQHDRTRRNELVAAGWTVLNFTWGDLIERPEYVAAAILRALAAA